VAVKKDASLCVEVLLARSGGSGNALKLELDAKDMDGLTALHCAIMKGQPAVVRLLLEAGADFTMSFAGRPDGPRFCSDRHDAGTAAVHEAARSCHRWAAVTTLSSDSKSSTSRRRWQRQQEC